MGVNRRARLRQLPLCSLTTQPGVAELDRAAAGLRFLPASTSAVAIRRAAAWRVRVFVPYARRIRTCPFLWRSLRPLFPSSTATEAITPHAASGGALWPRLWRPTPSTAHFTHAQPHGTPRRHPAQPVTMCAKSAERQPAPPLAVQIFPSLWCRPWTTPGKRGSQPTAAR